LPEPGAGVVTVPPPLALSDTDDSTALFLRPVEGPVMRPFSNALGAARNDGIDFEAAAGSSVRAADSGQVVYVAQSVGDFGRIVMVRHPNDLVTAYARLGEVQVTRGDTVSRGQVIGTVAPSDAPSVQFQVLQNMSPVDPEPFF
jgi:murein DD-endopeptidase MepM/ murein hydrolase activator NlpD